MQAEYTSEDRECPEVRKALPTDSLTYKGPGRANKPPLHLLVTQHATASELCRVDPHNLEKLSFYVVTLMRLSSTGLDTYPRTLKKHLLLGHLNNAHMLFNGTPLLCSTPSVPDANQYLEYVAGYLRKSWDSAASTLAVLSMSVMSK